MTTEQQAREALRVKAERKAFEAWADGYLLEAGVTRDYASPATQRMWEAWLEASSRAAEDKRIADAVRGGVHVQVADNCWIGCVPAHLADQKVIIIAASVLEGE